MQKLANLFAPLAILVPLDKPVMHLLLMCVQFLLFLLDSLLSPIYGLHLVGGLIRASFLVPVLYFVAVLRDEVFLLAIGNILVTIIPCSCINRIYNILSEFLVVSFSGLFDHDLHVSEV